MLYNLQGLNAITILKWSGIGDGRFSSAKLSAFLTHGEKYPDARDRIFTIDVLIIEEVSMLSMCLFNKLEQLCCLKNVDIQFGGIQIVLVGDFYQLSPVCNAKYHIDTGFCVKVFALERFNKPRYPAMKSLVTALLTIFSGPLVESSFNIMDDIVEKDRASLTVENYETVAIVKSTMRKTKIKSYEMKVSSKMKRSCINAYSTYRAHLQRKKDLKQQQIERVCASAEGSESQTSTETSYAQEKSTKETEPGTWQKTTRPGL